MAMRENTLVVILASDDCQQWDGVPRQLLAVGRETIIARVHRQVREHGVDPLIVTHRQELRDAADQIATVVFFLDPPERGTACDALLSTVPLWKERTVVLPGDVVYSKATINAILTCNDQVRVFGNNKVIFAWTWVAARSKQIEKALQRGSHYGKGRLRYAYRALIGFPMGQKDHGGQFFSHVQDWTIEIDTPHDYERLQTEVVQQGILNV